MPRTDNQKHHKVIRMEHIYYVGDCPICKVGRMEVFFNIDSEKCTIICDECMLEFESFNDYKNVQNSYRDCNYTGQITARYATLEEIRNTEFYPYINDKD